MTTIHPYKVIGFDVDHTVVHPKSGGTFRKEASDWELLPGRERVFRHLLASHIPTAFATNQGGVAHGIYTEQAIYKEIHRLAESLCVPYIAMCFQHPGGNIGQYVFPDIYMHNGKPYDRRKPGPGMLFEICDIFAIQPSQMLFVGDSADDEGAALAAGTDFLLAEVFFTQFLQLLYRR